MRRLVLIALMRGVSFWDRLRLRWLLWLHPGLEIHRSASSALACARYSLGPGARLVIGAGVVTERNPRALSFELGAGAHVEIGEGTWLRTTLGPVNVVAFEEGRIELGPECFLNGSHVSAKRSLTLGRRVWLGPGSRVFDADQHDFDDARPERCAPVAIGDCVWVAGDVTVLRGVTIGEHSVIGTRSMVTRDVPPHTLAYGVPAEPRGEVGDRSHTR